MKLTIVVFFMGLGGLSVLYGAQAQEDPTAGLPLSQKAQLAAKILTAAAEELTRLESYKWSRDNSEVGINCSIRSYGENYWEYEDYNQERRSRRGRTASERFSFDCYYGFGCHRPNGGHEVILKDVNVKMKSIFTNVSGEATVNPKENNTLQLQGLRITMDTEFFGTGKRVFNPWRERNLLQRGWNRQWHGWNNWGYGKKRIVRVKGRATSTFPVDIEMSEKTNGTIEVKPLPSNGTVTWESSNRHRPDCNLDRKSGNEAIRETQDGVVAHLANLIQNVFATRDVGETTTVAVTPTTVVTTPTTVVTSPTSPTTVVTAPTTEVTSPTTTRPVIAPEGGP